MKNIDPLSMLFILIVPAALLSLAPQIGEATAASPSTSNLVINDINLLADAVDSSPELLAPIGRTKRHMSAEDEMVSSGGVAGGSGHLAAAGDPPLVSFSGDFLDGPADASDAGSSFDDRSPDISSRTINNNGQQPFVVGGHSGQIVERRYSTGADNREHTRRHETADDGESGNDIDDDFDLSMMSEDDDLFLAKGSSLYLSASDRSAASARAKRGTGLRSASISKMVSEQVRTIYFGGFFPWLTDEKTTSPTPAPSSSSLSAAGKQQTKRRPSAGARRPSARDIDNHQEPVQGLADSRTAAATTTRLASSSTINQAANNHRQPNENATLPAPVAATAVAPAISSSSQLASESRHQLGRFILPAVRLALDHINTNSSVLGSYKLEIVPRDTQCNATISLKEFFDMVYEEPKKMLLYGDACRVSTDPIAKASYFFDLIQISYADTDPIYTIENYPNFFRVVPSENALSLARIPFIRHFNWTRVGTIYQNLPRYSLPHSKLLTDLERYNIVIKQSVSLPGSVDALQNRDLGDELRKLKEKDVRIILGNFDEEWGLLLFCEAFRERMTGRKYQWILTGMNEDKLWQHYKIKGSACSEQELLIAMDGYIITDITPVTRSQHRTISGMMAHEYSNEYRRRAREMNISIEENKFYGYVYDGIWAIALALHRVDHQLRYYNQLAETGKVQLLPEMEGLSSLLDFDYHKPIWVQLIRRALNRTRFNGVTGTVSFIKNERPGLISFSQFLASRDMSEVIIGSYDALADNLDLKVGFPIFWRGHSPPIDYTIERVTPFRINRTLFVIISILAIFGIVLAFVFLFINIKFRDQRYIKMSSPYLNNLIIIGCILTYTSVIILGLDSGLTSEYNFPYICNARAWVLMAGFTLAFGSMFSKTFRVHSIFTNIKLHKKVIKDYKLFMVVFILLTLDVCILVIWQYFDPFYRDTNNGTSIQDSDNEDVIIVPEMEHCQSKRMTIFLSVIYVYKGLLMAFGCFLAWETRHVSIPALNDSKYIGLSVYNVVIMCVIGAGLSFVLRDQQDASFVIISIFIIFCSTTTLCLVFVPKLIELKQNPRAGDHRVRATLKTFKKNYQEEAIGAAAGCRDIHGNIIGRGYGVNLNERIKILLDENVKQRSALKEKTYELEALTYKYRKIQSMIQSGQYFQALSATIGASGGAHSPVPTGKALMPASSITTNLPTTVMLTSRSPTQERVVSILKDTKHPTTTGSINIESGELIKSPLMFSNTQITTTNTTSSTNNHTDLTADYLSTSKLTATNSTATNNSTARLSSDGCKRALVVALDRGLKDKNLSIVADELLGGGGGDNDEKDGANKRNECLLIGESSKFLSVADKLSSSAASSRRSAPRNSNQSIGCKQAPTDSSYCSMGAGDYELGTSGMCSDSQQDDDVFTVFSYAANSNRRGAEHRAGDVDEAENSFNRWSEGPFCTLMVKNRSERFNRRAGAPMAPGRAVPIKAMADIGDTKLLDDNRASCPDLQAKLNNSRPNVGLQQVQKNRLRKQLSQQTDSYYNARSTLAVPETKLALALPRTISMIEYLGLDEFDLIARRHDKLISGRDNKRQPPACCFAPPTEPIECVYCATKANLRRAQRHQKYLTQSEADMAGEPMNSEGELIQSSSRLSCSTCCSLASQSYISQSDIFNESSTESSGSGSTSSQLMSSQGVSGGFSASGSLRNPRYLSHDHIDESSASGSGSTIDEISLNANRYFHHHTESSGSLHGRCRHHHHQSTESSPFPATQQSKSTTSAPANERLLGTAHHNEISHHCDQAISTRGNNEAQTAGSDTTTSAAGTSTTTTTGVRNSPPLPTSAEHVRENEQKFSIKCDVLESL